MKQSARFLRAIGFIACVTGLSVLLFLATNRFYTQSGANPVLAAQKSEIDNHLDRPILSSEENSETKSTRPIVSRQEVSTPEVPFFSVPQTNPVPKEIVSSRKSPDNKKTSSTSPAEPVNAVIRLVIPELRLDAKVQYIPFEGNTWDLNDLGQSVAWLGKMSGKETIRNLVLAGHITVGNGTHGPFRYLSRLDPGAKITVYTNHYILTYQVRELLIVKPEDAHLTADTSESQLTLLTCATWNEKTRSYLRRQVVFADLLEVEPNSQGTAK